MASSEPSWSESEAPQRGMSTTTKMLLIFGGIGGVLMLACCGGVAYIGVRGAAFLQQSFSEDPVVIRQRTQDMVQIDIPDSFEPEGAFDFIILRMVMYRSSNQSALMLMEMNISMAGTPQEQRDEMLRGMRQQQQKQNAPGGANAQVNKLESTTKEIEIDGKPVEFEFIKGTQQGQNRTVRQVLGVLEGKRGAVMLMLIVPEEDYDEDAVIKMLKSIRAKQGGNAKADGREDDAEEK
jgi:hypothetical protein